MAEEKLANRDDRGRPQLQPGQRYRVSFQGVAVLGPNGDVCIQADEGGAIWYIPIGSKVEVLDIVAGESIQLLGGWGAGSVGR